MEQFKRAQVVMLPTDIILSNFRFSLIETNIALLCNKDSIVITNENSTATINHLYFISDDEIKVDDYYILFTNKPLTVLKCTGNGDYFNSKKIIATTDKSLTFNYYDSDSYGIPQIFPLPQPSQQFITKYIEEYNKDNIITDVLVEYEDKIEKLYNTGGSNYPFDYLDSISKKEVLKINPKDNTITIKKLKDSFNLEEMYKLMDDYQDYLFKTNQPVKTFKEWFNKNL